VEKEDTSIHFLYSLNSTQGRGNSGAYPSCHWARSRVQPGHVASPSKGHIETNNHSHSLTPRVNLESPTNLTYTFLGSGRKPEYPEMGRTCKLLTERKKGFKPGTLYL